MKWLLGTEGREALRLLTAGDALVAFDFDGTLAPIVGDRRAAAMRPATLALLRRVAERYPTIVVTGRARADALGRLRGVGLRAVVGNHGAEPARAGPGARRWRGQVRAWARALGEVARKLPGVEIEQKELSVTAHYRHAADPERARRLLLHAAAALGGGRVVGGKRVVSVLPAGAPHKGHALADAARRWGARRVLFLGDDETDEDAFAHPLGVPATMVRVGARQGSRAGWFLRDQVEVDQLLEVLAGQAAPVSVAEGPETAELPPVLAFLRCLWELDHALNARSKRMLADVGVTSPQRLVILALARGPGASPAEVARLLHLHPASVTRLVAGLERRGLVARRRNPRDARRLSLTLTPRGQGVEARRTGTIEAEVGAVLGRAPPGRAEAARALLGELAAALHPGRRPRARSGERLDG